MVKSTTYQLPLSDNATGMRDINNTIVDSGLRMGQQVYKLVLRQNGSVTPDVIDLDTNSNGLSVDIAGVTISVLFSTDTETTINVFAAAILSTLSVEEVTVNGNDIEVKIAENSEVLIDNPSVTGSPVATQLSVVLQNDLRIIPAVVTIAADPVALRVDEPSASITYTGYAEIGTADADPLWRIKKVEKVGNVTSIGFAEGNTLSNKIWNDRAGYTYS